MWQCAALSGPPRRCIKYLIVVTTVFLTVVIWTNASGPYTLWHGHHGSFAYDVRRNPNMCQSVQAQVSSERQIPRQDVRFNEEGVRVNHTGWVGANRVMNGCWTYKERYKTYDHLPPSIRHQIECNHLYPRPESSKMAFVIRMSYRAEWNKDLVLSIKAIVVEIGWRMGIDVFIMQHIKSPKSAGESPDVPEEFRSFVIQFTLEDYIRKYDPAIVRPIRNPPKVLPVMAQYNHLAETYFMHQYPEYDTAWFMESDTRSTGPWDVLIHDIESSIAAKAPTGTTFDLVTFSPAYKVDATWPWGLSLGQFPNSTKTASLLQTHRISRRLAEAMHHQLLLRRNAYFEMFVPTVARFHGLNHFIYANPVFSDSDPTITGKPFTGIASVEIHGDRMQKKYLWLGNLEGDGAVLYHGATYSPIDAFARRYYEEWMQDQRICRPLSLVHPVKV